MEWQRELLHAWLKDMQCKLHHDRLYACMHQAACKADVDICTILHSYYASGLQNSMICIYI